MKDCGGWKGAEELSMKAASHGSIKSHQQVLFVLFVSQTHKHQNTHPKTS